MSYVVSEITTGREGTFYFPPSTGTRVVTLDGVAATISSQGYNYVTLLTVPAAGKILSITLEDRPAVGSGADKQQTLVSGTNIRTINGASLLGSTDILVGDVTLAGVQTLINKTVTETVFAITGTTPALTATNGAVQTWTLTAASTPTSALTSGQSVILQITPGAFAITWPSAVFTKVGGSGAAPTLFSAGKTTIVLWRVGAVLYGSHLGDTV